MSTTTKAKTKTTTSSLASVGVRLRELLASADVSRLTTRELRRTLETEFEMDLSSSKKWLKEEVQKFVDGVEKEDAKEDEKDVEKNEEDPSHPLLSEAMAKVCGVKRADHFRCVKLLWRYIKSQELQNPANKKEIICDDNLEAVFKKKKVTSFGMNKLIGSHIFKDTTPKKKRSSSKVVKDETPAKKKPKKTHPGAGGLPR